MRRSKKGAFMEKMSKQSLVAVVFVFTSLLQNTLSAAQRHRSPEALFWFNSIIDFTYKSKCVSDHLKQFNHTKEVLSFRNFLVAFDDFRKTKHKIIDAILNISQEMEQKLNSQISDATSKLAQNFIIKYNNGDEINDFFITYEQRCEYLAAYQDLYFNTLPDICLKLVLSISLGSDYDQELRCMLKNCHYIT